MSVYDTLRFITLFAMVPELTKLADTATSPEALREGFEDWARGEAEHFDDPAGLEIVLSGTPKIDWELLHSIFTA